MVIGICFYLILISNFKKQVWLPITDQHTNVSQAATCIWIPFFLIPEHSQWPCHQVLLSFFYMPSFVLSVIALSRCFTFHSYLCYYCLYSCELAVCFNWCFWSVLKCKCLSRGVCMCERGHVSVNMCACVCVCAYACLCVCVCALPLLWGSQPSLVLLMDKLKDSLPSLFMCTVWDSGKPAGAEFGVHLFMSCGCFYGIPLICNRDNSTARVLTGSSCLF